jgi:hypothetical protein
MSRYLAILFVLVALPVWSQLFSVRSTEGGNVPACVRLTPVLPKSQFPEISVMYRTQFIVADTSGNTVSIMKVTSSASDLMPTWSGDTLSLVFNYAAFAGSDIIVHRSLMIETAGCEVNLELEYRPFQLRPVMIATDRSAYTLNDTLFVTVNGTFRTDGACWPGLHWGLQRKVENGWEEVVDLDGKPAMCCGPGTQRFIDNRRAILEFNAPYHAYLLERMPDGEYRLYGFENTFQERVFSNVFVFSKK